MSPVILDQEKKLAHLEDMLRSLNLNRVATASSVVRVNVDPSVSVAQQLKEQNAVLVNLCLELSNELFAIKYKREEMAQRLQQIDVVSASATSAAGSSASMGAASTATGGQ